MTRPLPTRRGGAPQFLLLLLLCSLVATSPMRGATPGDLYTEALSHERVLRAPADMPVSLAQLRSGISRYEDLVRQYPRSGFSDNALWQAAGLALEAFERYREPADQQRGERLLQMLANEYPSSALVSRVSTRLAALAPPPPTDSSEPADVGAVSLRSVTRETLSDVVRVTLELEDEVPYVSDRLDGPARLYFDLDGTDAVPGLLNATLPFDDGDVIREIRLGRHPEQTTRVVLDLEGVESYSVYALYSPYRLVVDSVRLPEFAAGTAGAPGPADAAPPVGSLTTDSVPAPDAWVDDVPIPEEILSVELPVEPVLVPMVQRVIEPVESVVDTGAPIEAPLVDPPVVTPLDLPSVPTGWSEALPLVASPPLPEPSVAVDEPEEGLATEETPGLTAGTPDVAVAVAVGDDAVPPADELAWPRVHDLLYPELGTPPSTLAAGVTPAAGEIDIVPVLAGVAGDVPPVPISMVSLLEFPRIDSPIELPSVRRDPVAPGLGAASPGVVLTDAPVTTTDGVYSLGRQLGLGVSRVAIDPGHGGYDPGARSGDLFEAAVVLDIAERLETKLLAEGIEVVMTRRGDVYVPLRARTDLANQVEADLFLSIHANSADDPALRGIETYHLDFATDPTAQAVVARENAASGEHMHDLPDLVRSIAMDNKVNESRALAALVQRNLMAGVRETRPDVQDLGVKQAPFMVLIGATMPSVLTEISFLSNDEAAAYLATDEYRNQIADALFASIVGYQMSLQPINRLAANDN